MHELRTDDDSRDLRAALDNARNSVVIAAGFIGLEFAAAACSRGVEVTILEASPFPLGRAVSTLMAGHIASAHREEGADLRCSEPVTAIHGIDGAVASVEGASGEVHDTELVVMGTGVLPRTALAERAGLKVADGVVVDGHLRTSDPAIYAIGDCARVTTGARPSCRLESVQNATDQGRHVAASILGQSATYSAVPWFWSHQGSVRLQIAGLADRHDTARVLGDPTTGKFSVLRYHQERLVAVESLVCPVILGVG